MKSLPGNVLACALLLFGFNSYEYESIPADHARRQQSGDDSIFGFRDSAAQLAVESRFWLCPTPSALKNICAL